MESLSAGSTGEKSIPPDNFRDKTWLLNLRPLLQGVAFKNRLVNRKMLSRQISHLVLVLETIDLCPCTGMYVMNLIVLCFVCSLKF